MNSGLFTLINVSIAVLAGAQAFALPIAQLLRAGGRAAEEALPAATATARLTKLAPTIDVSQLRFEAFLGAERANIKVQQSNGSMVVSFKRADLGSNTNALFDVPATGAYARIPVLRTRQKSPIQPSDGRAAFSETRITVDGDTVSYQITKPALHPFIQQSGEIAVSRNLKVIDAAFSDATDYLVVRTIDRNATDSAQLIDVHYAVYADKLGDLRLRAPVFQKTDLVKTDLKVPYTSDQKSAGKILLDDPEYQRFLRGTIRLHFTDEFATVFPKSIDEVTTGNRLGNGNWGIARTVTARSKETNQRIDLILRSLREPIPAEFGGYQNSLEMRFHYVDGLPVSSDQIIRQTAAALSSSGVPATRLRLSGSSQNGTHSVLVDLSGLASSKVEALFKELRSLLNTAGSGS